MSIHLLESDAVSSFGSEVSQDLVCHSSRLLTLLSRGSAVPRLSLRDEDDNSHGAGVDKEGALIVSQCGRVSNSREGTIGYPE